jgi:intein/homing endonuclease
VAGTLVLSTDGQVPIEEIREGDIVWSENPETGERGLKRVAQAFVRETDEFVHIKVNGQEITTTPEHPFWIPQKGWTNAI